LGRSGPMNSATLYISHSFTATSTSGVRRKPERPPDGGDVWPRCPAPFLPKMIDSCTRQAADGCRACFTLAENGISTLTSALKNPGRDKVAQEVVNRRNFDHTFPLAPILWAPLCGQHANKLMESLTEAMIPEGRDRVCSPLSQRRWKVSW